MSSNRSGKTAVSPQNEVAICSTRVAVPILCATIGIFLLIGCIPIPLPEKVVQGKDFRAQLKPPAANRLLSRGRSTRREIEMVLGSPTYRDRTGRQMCYYLETRAGAYVYPLCFNATEMDRIYVLQLEYDDAGVLKSWNLLQGVTDPILGGSPLFRYMSGGIREPTTRP